MRVVNGRAADSMAVQKYDIRRPESEGGGYEERYWSPVNTAVMGVENKVAYIIHRVEDVTEFVRAKMRSADQERVAQELQIHGERLQAEIVLREEEIAQRKRAEADLRQAEERMRSIVDNVIDGIISIDGKGMVESYNLAAQKIFGYSASEVIGQNVRMLMPEPYYGEHDDYLANYMRSRVAKIIGIGREVVGRRKCGSQFPMDLAISTFVLGSDPHFTGIVRDITRRKSLEAQFQQAQKMEVVGHLAGGIAHDFNNLLAVILGCCQFLENDTALTHESRKLVDEIDMAANRAAGLTRQLLAFSRQQILQPKVLNLNEIVTEAVTMLKRLIGEDVELNTKLLVDLWPVKVDAGQMNQVIMNLAVNARDAMRVGGTLTIESANVEVDDAYVHAHPNLKKGSFVVLSVSDTGCGMDQTTLSHLFEPFFTTKEVGKGTGLGLATVFGIVKQSGGLVTVYSEIGRGTIFKVYLPIDASATAIQPENKVPDKLPRGTETVLIVEDEQMIRKLVCRILQTQGYTVLQAENGDEALRVFEGHPSLIKLVLTDVVLPKMGGRQLYDRLIALQPGLKVLYMSGYTDDSVIRHGALEAATNFIQKPFSYTALAEAVRAVLDQ